MASKPPVPKKLAAQSARAAAARKPAPARRVAGRTDPGGRTTPFETGAYLPPASDSKAARRHRVLAPTLKPTRVSEEDIAEAVRNFRRP